MKVEFRKHNIEFEKLQSEYLSERKVEILSKMYKVAYKYCVNLILQYVHQKGLIWEDKIIEDKAHDCATWLIEPYLRNPNFKIKKLSSYAHFAKLKILYSNKDEQKLCSLEELIETCGDNFQDYLSLK